MPEKVYNLADIIKRETEAKPPITITFGDTTVEIPQPIFWPDSMDKMGDIESAKMLLGDDYEAFVEQGGNAALFWRIVNEALGATRPESPASTD